MPRIIFRNPHQTALPLSHPATCFGASLRGLGVEGPHPDEFRSIGSPTAPELQEWGDKEWHPNARITQQGRNSGQTHLIAQCAPHGTWAGDLPSEACVSLSSGNIRKAYASVPTVWGLYPWSWLTTSSCWSTKRRMLYRINRPPWSGHASLKDEIKVIR